MAPSHRWSLLAFIITIPLHLIIIQLFPDMNYFVRAMWVILIAFGLLWITSTNKRWKALNQLLQPADQGIARIGLGLASSLAVLHIIFH